MHIEIRGRLKPTPAIRQHAERRLSFAVRRFRHRVRAITLWFDDINGPGHGGADKACRISIALDEPHHPPLVVEEVHVDLYRAISLAAARASHSVRREIDRLTQVRARSSATAS